MTPIDAVLLLAGTAGLLLAAGWYGRDRWRERRERRAVDRLRRGTPRADALSPAFGRAPSPLQRRLRAAGFPDSPLLYLSVVFMVAGFFALWILELFRGLWPPALIAFGLSLSFFHLLVREVGRVRSLRFEEKLVNAVDLMISALRSGENPPQALASASAASPQPVRREFADVVHRLSLGMPIRGAVAGMMGSYDSEGVRLFCNTLAAKWSVGGDFAPVLHSVNRMMRERLRHRLHLRSQLAGAQLSSLLVAAAPYVLLLGFYVQRPDWLDRLLNHPIGSALLFSAIAVQLLGLLWLHRMLRMEL